MKADAVPQDGSAHYGGVRKAMYAVDETGRYTTVESDGWRPEAAATLGAVGEYARLAEEARRRVLTGSAAPLEFHMYDRRMDVAILAETVGTWRWRVRRHMRPKRFATLSPSWRQRYADALGLTPAQLDRLPAATQP